MEEKTDLQPADPLQLGILLGIFSQLHRTRTGAILDRTDLTDTQVGLLSHLSRVDEPATIGELADALEVNQPGVTKVVKRLDAVGLLEVAGSPEDGRRKLVSISAEGGDRLGRALESLGVDMAQWFEGWPDDELASFQRHIQRLVDWLDHNRLAESD